MKMTTTECVSLVLKEDDNDRMCLVGDKRRCKQKILPYKSLSKMTTTDCVSTVLNDDHNDRMCLDVISSITSID